MPTSPAMLDIECLRDHLHDVSRDVAELEYEFALLSKAEQRALLPKMKAARGAQAALREMLAAAVTLYEHEAEGAVKH